VEIGTNDFGFDYSFIIPASLDFAPYYYVRNRNVVQQPTVEQAYVEFPRFVRAGLRAKDFHFEDTLDDLLAEAVTYIKKQAKTKDPFFLYFPLTAPHKPIIPHPRFQGKTDIGPYGDFVTQVDWTVGQVLKTLDDTDLAENTLIIFSSDNGSYMIPLFESDSVGHGQDETIQAYRADDHKANAYFRGGKADIWEGGHRTPFFARWPGVVKPDSKCDETICLTDIFATCADITGAEIDDNAAEDSFSFLPLLRGEEPAKKRAPVIHHSASATFSIRSGKYKLVLGTGSGGREVPRGRAFEKPYQLFNLEKDPSEKKNIIEENPKMAEKLEDAFQQIFEAGASRKIKAKAKK
jgi:arylsulfatase A-like enzyme